MQLLSHHQDVSPDKPALIFEPSGHTVTYGELADRTWRLMRLLHDQGLRRGDHLAILMENNPRFLEVCWAALKSGMYVTAINRYLTADEAGFILGDCSASVLVTSAALAETATGALTQAPNCAVRLMVDGAARGFTAYEDALAAATPGRSRTGRATSCSTARARPGGQRASSGRSRTFRSRTGGA